jgi:type I restriction enzyme, S subunit
MALWNTVMSSAVAVEDRFDGEYYSPFYLDMDTTLSRIENVDVLHRLVFSIRKGIFDISPNRYREKGIPLVRTLQIKSPLLSKESLVFIDAEDHAKNFSKTELVAGDIVFTKIGAGIGDVAVLPLDFERYNFSQNVAGASVNRKKIDGFYLLAYLATKWGRKQLLRYMMPSGQGKLELRDIKKIRVVRLGDAEPAISGLIVEAEMSARVSQEKYALAKQLLESALGLDELTFQRPVGFIARFSEVMSERRANAEYFSPVAKRLLSLKLFEGSKPLAAHFSILRGKTTTSYPKGAIAILKTKAIRTPSIDLARVGDFAQTNTGLTEIEEGDLILASMGVGSLGRISYAYQLSKKFAIDGTLRILRRKLDVPEDIEVPQMLFLTSRAGQELIYRGIVGSTGIISLPDAYLKRIPVPEIDSSVRKELTSLVRSSIEAKDTATKLLNCATARVEQLIEEAVQS